ncbi:uncharacterized protein LOC133286132 [Gastrolobium bilobum]|uniref:uncharacterized protein LOC133286132 n=1 Tax=Gastrolobium bilobum TaxID=150636 RepID=UPI002AB24B42|nr:uncharacterized protein LOC133286132 [Gastrolobium bilobum]
MPRKSLPISHKVSNLVRFIHKLRKPMIQKLLLFKKFRKCKEFKLIRHYNYDFIGEYQHSPSSTPLIHYRRNQFKNRGSRYLCSFFYLFWCLGNLKVGGSDIGIGECKLEALPLPLPLRLPPIEIENAIIAEDLFEAFDSDSEDEGESVDQKAERFIERFYQQMKMQRQESI